MRCMSNSPARSRDSFPVPIGRALEFAVRSKSSGSIGLQRGTDSIIVGNRHAIDLGSIDALAAPIEHDGFLQPVTVTLTDLLICRARRLAALRHLGHKIVTVWVRSEISERLGELMAAQDGNVLQKPLSQPKLQSCTASSRILSLKTLYVVRKPPGSPLIDKSPGQMVPPRWRHRLT